MDTNPLKQAMSEYFRALGSKGGKKGGKLRWAGKTAEERSVAMKLVAAGKKRPDDPPAPPADWRQPAKP